jgi:hypothetical protein
LPAPPNKLLDNSLTIVYGRVLGLIFLQNEIPVNHSTLNNNNNNNNNNNKFIALICRTLTTILSEIFG